MKRKKNATQDLAEELSKAQARCVVLEASTGRKEKKLKAIISKMREDAHVLDDPGQLVDLLHDFPYQFNVAAVPRANRDDMAADGFAQQ